MIVLLVSSCASALICAILIIKCILCLWQQCMPCSSDGYHVDSLLVYAFLVDGLLVKVISVGKYKSIEKNIKDYQLHDLGGRSIQLIIEAEFMNKWHKLKY